MRSCPRRCGAWSRRERRHCVISLASADWRHARRLPRRASRSRGAAVHRGHGRRLRVGGSRAVPRGRHDHRGIAGRRIGRTAGAAARRDRRSSNQECRGNGADWRRARAAGAGFDSRQSLELARGAHRGPRADASDGTGRTRCAQHRRRDPSPSCASRRGGAHERSHAAHSSHSFGRHRRQRHGRHRRSAAESGLRSAGLGSQVKCGDATARTPRRQGLHRPCSRASRQRGRGGGLERSEPRESGSCGRARRAHTRRAAGGDARRTDAVPLLHRGRGHPWQDNHHEPGRERARRRGPRPDVRHRRPPQERGQQCAARRGALPRRGGRRERCLVHASAADDRDRHQHRQRSSGDARGRFRETEAELRRFSAQPAVLWPRGVVHR